MFYIAVGTTITGLVPYQQLDVSDPIAVAVDAAGGDIAWLRPIVKLGAIFGLTSVIMVLIGGMSRIFFSMAEDGLLPQIFSRVHATYRTPKNTIFVTGVLAALIGGLLPVDVLGEMVSIGTLSAFVVVCSGVVALRRSSPELHRPFKVPWSPYIPMAGVLTALLQIFALPPET